jgi:hypothetical protein
MRGLLEVSDQGAGIPVGDREAIFEPFHRLRAAGSGSGLGLHLVKEIVQHHGGSVSVGEAAGSGASFRSISIAAPRGADAFAGQVPIGNLPPPAAGWLMAIGAPVSLLGSAAAAGAGAGGRWPDADVRLAAAVGLRR